MKALATYEKWSKHVISKEKLASYLSKNIQWLRKDGLYGFLIFGRKFPNFLLGNADSYWKTYSAIVGSSSELSA